MSSSASATPAFMSCLTCDPKSLTSAVPPNSCGSGMLWAKHHRFLVHFYAGLRINDCGSTVLVRRLFIYEKTCHEQTLPFQVIPDCEISTLLHPTTWEPQTAFQRPSPAPRRHVARSAHVPTSKQCWLVSLVNKAKRHEILTWAHLLLNQTEDILLVTRKCHRQFIDFFCWLMAFQ